MKNIESIVTELCDELTWNLVRAFLSSLVQPPTKPSGAAPKPRLAQAQAQASAAPSPVPRKPSPMNLRPTARRSNARRAPAPRVASSEPTPIAPPAPPVVGPVFRVSLPSAFTRVLVEAIVDALQDGPLYSEDLRRELNLTRRELAKPLAEALKTRRIVKRGDRRETVYELGERASVRDPS